MLYRLKNEDNTTKIEDNPNLVKNKGASIFEVASQATETLNKAKSCLHIVTQCVKLYLVIVIVILLLKCIMHETHSTTALPHFRL